MLNDVNLNTIEKNAVDVILNVTKEAFSEHIPYRLYPSSVDRDAKIIVFSSHFIQTFRMVLSSPDSGCIIQMSDAERDLYYSYIEWVDGGVIDDPETLSVVLELNNCIVNEIECKVETYLQQCFDLEHAWDTCEIDTTSNTPAEKVTQAAYDQLVADGFMIDTKIYMIVLDNVVIKIMLAGVVLWQL